jgi:hypothetical protein
MSNFPRVADAPGRPKVATELVLCWPWAGVEEVAQLLDRFNTCIDQLPGWPPSAAQLAQCAEPLVAAFPDLTPDQQRFIRKGLSRRAKDALQVYTNQQARSAVNEHREDLLLKGLAALILIGDGNDFRDSYFALEYLKDCADQLHMSRQIFADAARVTDSVTLRERCIEFSRSRRTRS